MDSSNVINMKTESLRKSMSQTPSCKRKKNPQGKNCKQCSQVG